jgi:hypothetical protein
MSLFDRDKPPEGFPPDAVDMANHAVDRLRARLESEIVLGEPGSSVWCYLQAHIRRCFMFLDGGVAEWLASRPLVTEMCTRALYENIATVCDFVENLKPFCDAGDYVGVERLVEKAAFYTRIPSFLQKYGSDLKAPQILNQIDRMKTHYSGYREAY